MTDRTTAEKVDVAIDTTTLTQGMARHPSSQQAATQLPPYTDSVVIDETFVHAYWEDIPSASYWKDKLEDGTPTGKIMAVVPKSLLERAADTDTGYHVSPDGEVWLITPVFSMAGTGKLMGLSMARNDWVTFGPEAAKFNQQGPAHERVGCTRIAEVNPWKPPVPQRIAAILESRAPFALEGGEAQEVSPF